MGEPIPIASLAAMARLASRLGVPVFRSIRVASASGSIELDIHARPDAEGVAIEIGGWEVDSAEQPSFGSPETDEMPDATLRDLPSRFDWTVDADFNLLGLSGAAAGMWVVLIGQPMTRLFRLEAAPDGSVPLLDAFARARAFSMQPARLWLDGEAAYRLAAVPSFGPDGRLSGYLGSAYRIEPDEVPLPSPLQDQPEPAIDTLQPEAELGADIGEALRSPLEAIISNADSIHEQQDGPLRRGYADYAADIASAGRHLMSLVEDLVEVQAIEQSDFAIPCDRIDLCGEARRAVTMVIPHAAARTVEIELDCPDGAVFALGEGHRVVQILVNLLSNAVRHSPCGGCVRIEVRAEERGRVTACVIDEGDGIDPVDQTRIFEKFERLDRSDPSGSGLGLYISRRLARAMRGDLLVESRKGGGARFKLALPAE